MKVERNSISKKDVLELVNDIKEKLKKNNPRINLIKVDLEKDSYFYRAKIEMREKTFHFICEKKNVLWKKALFSTYKSILKKNETTEKTSQKETPPRFSLFKYCLKFLPYEALKRASSF